MTKSLPRVKSAGTLFRDSPRKPEPGSQGRHNLATNIQ
jgi:hypothetical protein